MSRASPPAEIEDPYIRQIWSSIPETSRASLIQAAQLQMLVNTVPPPSLSTPRAENRVGQPGPVTG